MNCETENPHHPAGRAPRTWAQAERDAARWIALHPQAWQELQRRYALMVGTQGVPPLGEAFLVKHGWQAADLEVLRRRGLRWALIAYQQRTGLLEV